MTELSALRSLRSSDKVVLDAVKERIARVDNNRFTRDSTSFDMGYTQAHRDLKAFIEGLEKGKEQHD
jgi:hypothetical protein